MLGGRYELGEPIGRGGMGEVRAGKDLRLHRDVAVKMLRPEIAADPLARQRFEAEARLAARLVHPHVVAVFDCGEDAGIPFLVMERLGGPTLADTIRVGPMDPDAVRTLGTEVLSALAAAHTAGLIHRDIKPTNVLAAGPGNWKLGDFGIAKSLEVTDPSLTSTGMIIGTPAYLAPERLAGGGATPGGDLYALGIVMYEALVGRTDHLVRPAASGTARPPLDQVRPGLPPDLVAVVTRAMDPDPAVRYGSAADMAAGLGGQAPIAATAPTVAFLSPFADATEPLILPPTPEPVAGRLIRSLHKRRLWLGALVAGIVVVLAGLAISSGSRQPASNPTTSLPTQSVTTTTSTTVAAAAATQPSQPPSTKPPKRKHGQGHD